MQRVQSQAARTQLTYLRLAGSVLGERRGLFVRHSKKNRLSSDSQAEFQHLGSVTIRMKTTCTDVGAHKFRLSGGDCLKITQ
jgi:hypothetical protein